MPIDILWGHDGLREGLEAGVSATEIVEGGDAEREAFRKEAESALLYAETE